MIEKIIYDYLSENTEVPVYLDQFESASDCIVLEKTGGGRTNRLHTAMIAVQSYGSSMFKAASLNETVKQLMLNAVSLPDISAVSINSDYNFTDTEAKRYRYQAVFDIVYYGGY